MPVVFSDNRLSVPGIKPHTIAKDLLDLENSVGRYLGDIQVIKILDMGQFLEHGNRLVADWYAEFNVFECFKGNELDARFLTYIIATSYPESRTGSSFPQGISGRPS